MNDMHSIILSNSAALALFGNEEPVNKIVKIDNHMDVTVTGIYEDIARNARFGDVQFFAPWSLLAASTEWIKKNENNWNNTSFHIYVQLQPAVSLVAGNAALAGFYQKNAPLEIKAQTQKNNSRLSLYQPPFWQTHVSCCTVYALLSYQK